MGHCSDCVGGHLADVRIYHGAVSGRSALHPDELREAAQIDGANELQIYRHIMFPCSPRSPSRRLIILGHMSLKVFDLIIAVAGKQLPLDVPAIYMWQTTFDGLFYGRGAAIGILLLISVAVLIIPYIRYTLKTETQA